MKRVEVSEFISTKECMSNGMTYSGPSLITSPLGET